MSFYDKLWGIKESVKSDIRSLGDKLQMLTPVVFVVYEACYGDHYTSKVFVAAFIINMAICSLLKALFNNPRPREVDGSKNPELDLDWSPNKGNSFPSGHTASAMIGAFFWFEISVYAGVIGLLLGVITALSRIIAKAHWLRDVATSTVIACAIYLACKLYIL